MEKSICIKCVWADCKSAKSAINVSCYHPSNTYTATNYVTGNQTITFQKSCIDRNRFGNCCDFVKDITQWRKFLRKYFLWKE